MPVGDIKELKPIIESYVKDMYSGKLTDVRISSARKMDFAKEWHVDVEAEDTTKRYLFEVKVDDETSKVKSFEKRWEKPLKDRYTP